MAGPHRRPRVGPAALRPIGSAHGRSRARPRRPAPARARLPSRRRGAPSRGGPTGRARSSRRASPRRAPRATRDPTRATCSSLARRFEGKLTLTPGEHEKDALAGAVAVALKRASLFGRAPVVHDLTDRPHDLGLPRRGTRRPGRAPQAPLRGGVAPAPLRRAASARRPRSGGHPAPAPRPRSPTLHRADWRSLLGEPLDRGVTDRRDVLSVTSGMPERRLDPDEVLFGQGDGRGRLGGRPRRGCAAGRPRRHAPVGRDRARWVRR